MAPPLIKKHSFLRGGSNLVNYDYTEFSSGIGFIRYYGFTTREASLSYNLSDTQVYSKDIGTWAGGSSDTTMNFNSTAFSLPRYATGTAIVSFGMGATVSPGNNYYDVTIYKVTGVTATAISSTLRFTNDYPANTNGQCTMKIPLTATLIKKGDYLRLTILMHADSAGAGNAKIGHDPMGRYDGTYFVNTGAFTTQLILDMPFRVDR